MSGVAPQFTVENPKPRIELIHSHDIYILFIYFQVITPNMGLELMTLRPRITCSY